ncbi:peptidoglycan-binding domain-containing protein [Kitasatospora sp. NPDC093806]|uniref:peptidoglycan-binding domain-containing protein n=1 Tax=Kitasatospora sp. NPDC093806 TaxID=3155075 RepID=UPI003438713A
MKLNTKAALGKGAVALTAALLVVGAGASAASAKVGARNIRYGDRGSAVTCVQLALNHYNSTRSMPHPEMALSVDGQFGGETLRVLKAYQSAQGLDADGVVGPNTGDRLYWANLHTSDPYCYSVMPTWS